MNALIGLIMIIFGIPLFFGGNKRVEGPTGEAGRLYNSFKNELDELDRMEQSIKQGIES